MSARPALVLAVAVLAMSWAGPLTRLSAAPPLSIAAWRLVFSLAFIAVALAVTRRRGVARVRLSRADVLVAVGSGTLLALHFWSWIASLELTTVASSLVLVSTHPLFVAALSAGLLRERPGPRQLAGIAIGVAGAIVIGWGDFGRGRDPLLGDLLALAGAVFVSGYYVAGRRLRQRLDLWTYTGLVYGVAALVLVAAVSAHPQASLGGHRATDWWIFLALAAGPMLLGHTGVNYALRFVPAYVASLIVLAEAVGATLIAWWLPGIREAPHAQTLVGGALVLAGVLVAVAGGGRTESRSGAHG